MPATPSFSYFKFQLIYFYLLESQKERENNHPFSKNSTLYLSLYILLNFLEKAVY